VGKNPRDSQRRPGVAVDRASARRERVQPKSKRRSGRSKQITVLAGVAIVLIVVAMIAARVFGVGRRTSVSDTGQVSTAVMNDLSSVPDAVFNQVGQGSAQGLPVPVRGPLLRGASGRPQIVYFGAEYCPYCAAERWGLIVALSRFGTFSNLHTARSATDDVFPGTPTFTFSGSTYQSQYVDFKAVELQTSTRVGGTYQTLQTPTADEATLLARYNAPPYVPANSAGAIPFVDVGNQYVLSGSNFSPQLLADSSWDDVAANLKNPNSEDAKAIVGTANVITAAICASTNDTPASVCGQPAIKPIEAALARAPIPSGQ